MGNRDRRRVLRVLRQGGAGFRLRRAVASLSADKHSPIVLVVAPKGDSGPAPIARVARPRPALIDISGAPSGMEAAAAGWTGKR